MGDVEDKLAGLSTNPPPEISPSVVFAAVLEHSITGSNAGSIHTWPVAPWICRESVPLPPCEAMTIMRG